MALVKVLPNAEVLRLAGIPAVPFTVDEAVARAAIEGPRRDGGEVRLDLLVDGWARTLSADQQARVRDGPFLAQWACLVASERGRQGDAEGAEHYIRLGLQFAPTNLSLASRLGLALLGRGQLAQALVQFKAVMDDPRAGFSPTLWLAAARTASDLGLHVEAVRILEQCAAYMPAELDFWDLLGHEREMAGLGPPRPPRAAKASSGQWEVVEGPGDKWESVDDWKEVKD